MSQENLKSITEEEEEKSKSGDSKSIRSARISFAEVVEDEEKQNLKLDEDVYKLAGKSSEKELDDGEEKTSLKIDEDENTVTKDEDENTMIDDDDYEQKSEGYVDEEEHYDEDLGEKGEDLEEEDVETKEQHKKFKIYDTEEAVTKHKHKITLMTPSLLILDEKDKAKDKISTKYSTESENFGEEFEEMEEEHEDEIEEEEVKDEFIDKEAYLEMYQRLTEEKKLLRRRNAYLHRKMTEHLKKRNLESLLKEPTYTDSQELTEKYEKKLLTLAKKLEWHAAQKEKLTEELELMKKQVDEEQTILDATFEDFLKREREISVGLIDTSTGQPISDRLFNRLLNLQKQKFETIGEIRLECIRLRDKVKKKEKILESIETIGDNLHLVDYEYLCIENQNLNDKNEERDDELSKLHNKSAASIQILAHVRQKSYATAVDFQVMEEKLKEVEIQLSETRENLNTLKMQRDSYRSEAVRLKESSGLLTQMKLLHDFEHTNNEIVKARAELESIKKKFNAEQEELHQLQSLLNGYGGDRKSAS